jgi:hypothetical protein
VETEKIMWGLNTILLGVLAFFVRMWIHDMKETMKDLKKDLDSKQDSTTCEHFHKEISRHLHTHGTLGAAGEVIPR